MCSITCTVIRALKEYDIECNKYLWKEGKDWVRCDQNCEHVWESVQAQMHVCGP